MLGGYDIYRDQQRESRCDLKHLNSVPEVRQFEYNLKSSPKGNSHPSAAALVPSVYQNAALKARKSKWQ